MPEPRLLATFLNDQLAVHTAAVELAGRARSGAEHEAVRAVAAEAAELLGPAKAALLELMREHGIGRDRLKQLGALAGERAGRLKPNGRLFSRSPLSDVTELQALVALLGFAEGGWAGLDGLAAGGAARARELGALRERVMQLVPEAIGRALA